MDLNPTLFPAISNRETWQQVILLSDGDTGDAIELTDAANGSGNPLYGVNLEIAPAREPRGGMGIGISPFYDDWDSPVITGSLSNYITIIGAGVIQIVIPKSIMQSLRATQTYDVFLTLTTNGEDDGRQLLIGRLPVFYGGRST